MEPQKRERTNHSQYKERKVIGRRGNVWGSLGRKALGVSNEEINHCYKHKIQLERCHEDIAASIAQLLIAIRFF